MRQALTVASRELYSMFATPVAWILIAVYLVLTGYIFFLSLGFFLQQIQQIQALQLFQYLDQFNLNDAVIAPSIGTFSIFFIFIVPLLSMRAFAEERANGTIELLFTSPLSTWAIVLGKYLAVMFVVAVFVFLTALYPLLLLLYGDPELLQTLGALLALFLFGAVLAAIGCFVSSLTQSQMIAGVVSIVAGFLLLLLDVVADLTPPGMGQDLVRYLGIRPHFDTTLAGEIRSEDLAYFVAMVVFFLSLARTSLESLRAR